MANKNDKGVSVNATIDRVKDFLEKRKLDLYSENKQEEVRKIDDLTYELDQIKKWRIGTSRVFLILLSGIVILFVLLLLSINHSENLSDKNIDLIWSDSVLHKITHVDYDTVKEIRSVTYLTNNGKIITYDSLLQERGKLEDSIYDLTRKIKLVTGAYPITFTKENYATAKDTGTVISVVSPVIDSALLLLPYYRKKLFFNKKKNYWRIVIDVDTTEDK